MLDSALLQGVYGVVQVEFADAVQVGAGLAARFEHLPGGGRHCRPVTRESVHSGASSFSTGTVDPLKVPAHLERISPSGCSTIRRRASWRLSTYVRLALA